MRELSNNELMEVNGGEGLSLDIIGTVVDNVVKLWQTVEAAGNGLIDGLMQTQGPYKSPEVDLNN